ncbi:MAG: tripartite tricarboxylate transporter substrate binding protein [Betaproteobacteria bacterium]|nr:tripartite tricarboxylate transporter substrate binding protein [Betaproteobacteria bacterium]
MNKLVRFVCGLILLPFSLVQAAEEYPSRPVKIVVPWPAGGATDNTARIMGAKLFTLLKQPFVVENRTGAAGTIGTQSVAQAPPDGYTLLFMSASSHSVTPNMLKLAYDAIEDFTPISVSTIFPFVLVVPADSPYQNVKGLIRAAKESSGKITYGSPGIGGGAHLVTELFRLAAGIELVHVPSKGGGSTIIAELMSGQIQMMFDSLPAPLGQIRAGRLRALAVTSLARSSVVPEVPAMSEFIPGFEGVAWTGLGGPAKLPKPVVERLSAAVNQIAAEADYRQKIRDLGADPASSKTPELFRAFLLAEKARWGKVVAEAKITVAQ